MYRVIKREKQRERETEKERCSINKMRNIFFLFLHILDLIKQIKTTKLFTRAR